MSSLYEDAKRLAATLAHITLCILVACAIGLPAALIGIPEWVLVPGKFGHGFGQIYAAGGVFSLIGVAAGFAVVNIEMALVLGVLRPDVFLKRPCALEQHDLVRLLRQARPAELLAPLAALNFMAALVAVVACGLADTTLFRPLSVLLAAVIRYLINPIICWYWLLAGFTWWRAGAYELAVVNYAGLYLVGLGFRTIFFV